MMAFSKSVARVRANLAYGFTLVEVLIAATILFAALTVISDSFRASIVASRRADETVRLLAPLPFLVETIAAQIREKPDAKVSGGGQLLNVDYQFEATSILFKPPLPKFNPETTEREVFEPRYHLYDVSLTLRRPGVQRIFKYREIAWQSSSQ
jgi:hypothetical protein